MRMDCGGPDQNLILLVMCHEFPSLQQYIGIILVRRGCVVLNTIVKPQLKTEEVIESCLLQTCSCVKIMPMKI